MLILIIGLIILAGIAMTVGVLHNRQIQKKRARLGGMSPWLQ